MSLMRPSTSPISRVIALINRLNNAVNVPRLCHARSARSGTISTFGVSWRAQ